MVAALNMLWGLISFGRTGLGKLIYGSLFACAIGLWFVHSVESARQTEAEMLRSGVSIVVKQHQQSEAIVSDLIQARNRSQDEVRALEAKLREALDAKKIDNRGRTVVWTADDDGVLEATRVPR